MTDWRNSVESAAEYGVLKAVEVMMPMRDGVRLATDLYFPAEPEQLDRRVEGSFPVILIRTPYNKRGDLSQAGCEYFASRGYVVANQDCRGRYRSEGVFSFLKGEAEDGYDTIEWLAAQPWCDGQVGTMGTSYLGWTQTSAAVLNPPHLATMVVNQAGANAYTSSVRHNGALELRFLAWAFMGAATGAEASADPLVGQALEHESSGDWLRRLPWHEGRTPLRHAPSYERWALELYRNADYSAYWDDPGFNFMRRWDQHADVPVLYCGAWYDSYTRATLENVAGLSERKRGPIRLVMGPWTHGSATVDQSFAGDVEFGPTAPVAGNLARDFNHLHLRWFDRWLKGMDNGVDAEAPVRYFTMGGELVRKTVDGRLYRGGAWHAATELPLPQSVETAFYLQPGGGLRTASPPADGGSSTFRFDPANPVPTIGGNISSLADAYPVPLEIAARLPYEWRWGSIVKVGGQDQRTDPDIFGAQPPYGPLAARQDVLVFQTEPLAEAVEVTGPLSAVLYISSSAPDTDFTVKLVDVLPPSTDYPAGYELNLSDTIFRCRYRADPASPELMERGQVYELRIPLYGTSTIFGAGHRIRVDVSSSNFPRFDVNPNTGEPVGFHTHLKVADNSVHHQAGRASCIVLPVVPAARG